MAEQSERLAEALRVCPVVVEGWLLCIRGDYFYMEKDDERPVPCPRYVADAYMISKWLKMLAEKRVDPQLHANAITLTHRGELLSFPYGGLSGKTFLDALAEAVCRVGPEGKEGTT